MAIDEKQRWPLADAECVAMTLCDLLENTCVRCVIAGSIRRRKPTVGDIQLLFIPHFADRQVPPDLFPKRVSLADLQIEALLRTGTLAKRLNKNGGTAWGEKNKLAVHVASGIPVDLFSATTENWFNYLVCRTGGTESNMALCNAAIAKGWKWNPYGTGFEKRAGYGRHVVTGERDVFEFVGLPYRVPEERR